LAGLCREAAIAALREDLEGAAQVAARHFLAARAATRASLTPEVMRQYETWQKARGGKVGQRGIALMLYDDVARGEEESPLLMQMCH
jgi:DNA-binding transcriptional regulator YdaS (Cro superfamily)